MMKTNRTITAVAILFLSSILFPGVLLGGSATVTWNANTTDSDLAGYKVYYGTKSRHEEPSPTSPPYGPPAFVGKVTTYQVNGLKEGVKYYFAVSAVDEWGNESPFSDEVSKVIPDTPQGQ